MVNILLADDEKNILQLYKLRLEAWGFNVIVAEDGEEALDKFYNNPCDLVLMDIMMPKINGYEIIKEIRDSGYNTPVIMVTAKGELQDKMEGFRVGSDDYLVKPVEFEELHMRINAILRRAQINVSNKIEINGLTLDSSTLSIYDDKNSIILTKKEFQILYKLLSYPEKSFTKTQLFDEFWGIDSDSDIDSIKVYISKLRNKIQIFKQIDIKTIRGIGYRGIKNE